MKGIKLSGKIDTIREALHAISSECKTVAEYVKKTETLKGFHKANFVYGLMLDERVLGNWY